MPNKIKLVKSMLESFLDGFNLDANGKLVVINEKAANKASEQLSAIVLEHSREWWEMLEASGDSLQGMTDQIDFETLNGDQSGMDMSHDMGSGVAAPVSVPPSSGVDAMGGAAPSGLGDMATPAIGESRRGAAKQFTLKEFDARKLFEFDDEETDPDVVDGDEDYQDLSTGNDDAGMGEPSGDSEEGNTDILSGDESVDGTDDPMMGDDQMGGDPMGDDQMGGDPMGDDNIDGEFDFEDLADGELSGDFNDDMGGDDMGGNADDMPPMDDDEMKVEKPAMESRRTRGRAVRG